MTNKSKLNSEGVNRWTRYLSSAAEILPFVSTVSVNYGKSMGETSILRIIGDLTITQVHIEMIGRLTQSVNNGRNSWGENGSVLSLGITVSNFIL